MAIGKQFDRIIRVPFDDFLKFDLDFKANSLVECLAEFHDENIIQADSDQKILIKKDGITINLDNCTQVTQNCDGNRCTYSIIFHPSKPEIEMIFAFLIDWMNSLN
jgi:hypothetical protein